MDDRKETKSSLSFNMPMYLAMKHEYIVQIVMMKKRFGGKYAKYLIYCDKGKLGPPSDSWEVSVHLLTLLKFSLVHLLATPPAFESFLHNVAS